MNPYLEFVERIRTGVEKARSLYVSGRTQPVESDSKVLIFSPHPDDECIIGLLPLRLMRELGKQVINIPVTFGSNVERQADRANELDNACAYLGWDIHQVNDDYQAIGRGDHPRHQRQQSVIRRQRTPISLKRSISKRFNNLVQ